MTSILLQAAAADDVGRVMREGVGTRPARRGGDRPGPPACQASLGGQRHRGSAACRAAQAGGQPKPVVRAQASHGILLLDDDPGPAATVISRVRDRILREQDLNVLSVQLRQVAAVMPDESSGELDQFLEELAGQPQGAFLRPGAPSGEPPAASPWRPREEVAETVAEMLTRLAVVDGAPFSAGRLADWLSRDSTTPTGPRCSSVTCSRT